MDQSDKYLELFNTIYEMEKIIDFLLEQNNTQQQVVKDKIHVLSNEFLLQQNNTQQLVSGIIPKKDKIQNLAKVFGLKDSLKEKLRFASYLVLSYLRLLIFFL